MTTNYSLSPPKYRKHDNKLFPQNLLVNRADMTCDSTTCKYEHTVARSNMPGNNAADFSVKIDVKRESGFSGEGLLGGDLFIPELTVNVMDRSKFYHLFGCWKVAVRTGNHTRPYQRTLGQA